MELVEFYLVCEIAVGEFWPNLLANSKQLSEGLKGETCYLIDKIGLDLTTLEKDSLVKRNFSHKKSIT